jgi:hypothetical protein
MSSSLLRQDVLPVAVGYLLLMGALAAGLRLTWRDGHPPAPARGGATAATRDGPAGTARDGHPAAAGWLRLVRHYAGTAVGGYLLLMAVVVLYYYGVARVGGPFIRSAFTGCALLIALSAPVFALASWLTGRRSSRAGRRRSRAGRRHADPPAPRATP